MCAAASLVSTLVCQQASAGPVEILDGISIDPSNLQHMIVSYHYGGGGMFVTQDGAKTFSWLCSAGIATSAVNRNGHAFLSGDGSIYLGLADGLMKGGGDACGFASVPELTKKFIAAVTGDPFDPKRTYVITTTAMADNGIWMNDGSGSFKQMGSTVPHFLDDLFVVKNGDKRRFYETGIVTNTQTNEVTYSVRVSDDDAMTWTESIYDLAQFGPSDKFADFSIIAIDPTNPDRVVGRVKRSMMLDTLVVSDAKGQAGSWKLLAEPTDVDAVLFMPDGVMYFGDDGQDTKALYVVEKAGDSPKMLTNTWRPFCLGYDSAEQRILACSNYYLFGSVDPTSGAFTPLLDLRCAERMVECPGQPEMSGVCEPQARADFCQMTHWISAPVCSVYGRSPEDQNYIDSLTYTCSNGFAIDKEEEAPTAQTGAGGITNSGMTNSGVGTVASAGATAMNSRAGTSANRGSAGMVAAVDSKAVAPRSGGCSTTSTGLSLGSSTGLAFLAPLALWLRSARRRRSKQC